MVNINNEKGNERNIYTYTNKNFFNLSKEINIVTARQKGGNGASGND